MIQTTRRHFVGMMLDRILAGRTCERDLIRELAEALAAKEKQMLLYYNHSCNSRQDAAWEQAVGYHASNKERFAENLMEIVSWLGDRYQKRIKAWWFDSPYSLDPRGPHNSVTTDMTGFQFPWERFTVAAKSGYRDRLVTYNPGVALRFLYTTHQDYWAGELVNLDTPAQSRFLDNGLQSFLGSSAHAQSIDLKTADFVLVISPIALSFSFRH